MTPRTRASLCAAFVVALVAAPAAAQRAATTGYFPAAGDAWTRRTPRQAGLDSGRLAQAVAFAVSSEARAPRNLELAQLDDALLAGNVAAAEACVDAIESYDPGPVGHLRRAGASPADIARLYPY